MLKDQLKKQQPIVYRALENACANDRVMNAYLFSGPYGTMKNEAALLLAQSIFCSETNGLACEECNTCRRVREGLYTDLIVLDGKKKAISKEMVDSIQEQFSKTSLEGKEGKRVYIIQNAETASISAQNSMLKFLEEPGSGVTAILTTDNINRLLPTIVSRCTVLPFLPQSAQQYYQDAVDAGIPAEDAYLVSHIIRDPSQLMEFYESELYQKAVMMLKQFLNIAPYFWDEFLVDWETQWRSSVSDREKAKAENLVLAAAFFDLLHLYASDVIMHDAKGPAWYHDAVNQAKGAISAYGKLIIIADEQKDRVNRFNDVHLVMAQAFSRLEDFKHELG